VDTRISYLKKHPLILTLLLSLLLHGGLLLLFAPRHAALLFEPLLDAPPTAKKPLVFEFVETPSRPEETPSDQETPLISDKTQRARDNASEALPAGFSPFSEGMARFNGIGEQAATEAESRQTSSPSEAASAEQAEAPEPGRSTATQPKSNFNRNMLLAQSGGMPDARMNQKQVRAEDRGAISLNTYAWEYAPYLKELKRRIQKNIYPPSVFTRLGRGGSNALRFRIYPDGRLEGPSVLATQGEKALVATSRKAVTLSAPFPLLPDDFPEPFLEVTAKFDYFIPGM